MIEYIIITKPAEKEGENTIKLTNKELLQVGIKKDTETIESYLIHLNWAEYYEKDCGRPLKRHYYFVDRGIRIRYHTYDRDDLKPYINIQGCMHSLPRATNALYQFDKKLKEMFPEAEYTLKLKHIACCRLQPRIIFKKANLKQIKKTFPEFFVTQELDTKEHHPAIIPAGLNYEEDYTEHDDYYDCQRCDPDPCWGRYKKEKPEEDAHKEFYERRLPKRSRGSPRAYCIGTRTKEWPADTETVELGYWKLSSEELLSRINNPKQDDYLEVLIEERRMRVLQGKIKFNLTDKQLLFEDIAEILVADKGGCYAKLIELEEKGLIKEYHAKQEDS